VSVCQSDLVGAATVGGLPGVPMAKGTASSMCKAVTFDASTSGTASTALASPFTAMAIRSFAANAGEAKTVKGIGV